MNNTDSVLLKIENDIATLTLNRSHVKNVFNDEMINLLITHLQQIEKNHALKLLILKGNGEDFCAGGDIHWMQSMIHYSKEENHQDALKLAQLMHILYHLNIPTLVVTQGAVYGGAIGLVACCDIAFGLSNTKFCFSEVKLGLIPAVISPYVVNAMGNRAARRYLLSAEIFDAKEALQLGLLQEIIPENSLEKLEKKVDSLIHSISQNGPHALRECKKLLIALSKDNAFSKENLNSTAALIAKLRVSKEGQEGLKAFLEKRKPNWIKPNGYT